MPSAWFITWPGTAGKDNPSGMSRLITGTPLRLEDISVLHTRVLWNSTSTTVSLDSLPSPRWLHFLLHQPSCLYRETIPRAEDPVSTIVAIPDYHTTEAGRSSPFSQTPLIRKWCRGILILQDPLVASGNAGKRRRKEQEKFDWFTSSEDDIREEAARILKERRLGRVDKERTHVSRLFTARPLCHFLT
jgi:hypothetical protein